MALSLLRNRRHAGGIAASVSAICCAALLAACGGGGGGSGGAGSSSSGAGGFSSSSSSSSSSGSSAASSGSSSSSSSGGSSSGAVPAALAIRVQGNQLVDGNGKAVQLRGVNFSGFESVAVQGWDPADPSGGQGGQAGGPNWSAIAAWHANVVRLPLNEASWLGYSCVDTDGATHNPDPGGNYRQAVQQQVTQAVAAGLYVILDLHWSAPGNACPLLQAQMADADHSLDFWRSVAGVYKNNPAVLFDLFNEPFFDFEFSGNAWSAMMSGTQGSFTGYPATSTAGNWQDVKHAWQPASYQQMIGAVRGAGAGNVVLVGAVQYSQDLSGWLQNRPSDPQGQMAASWHAYPTYGSSYGSQAYAQPNLSPQVWSQVQAIRAAGFPVVATETGDQDSSGTSSAPLVSNVTAFADQNAVGVIGWTWDVWQNADNVLIKNAAGTPTDGYGQVFHDWLARHAD